MLQNFNKKSRQQQHYEKIHNEYYRHYFDNAAIAYRKKFILPALLEKDDLSGLTIAELACGSGENSVILKEIFPTVSVEGFDISPAACADYHRATGCPAHHADLTKTIPHDKQYDALIIIGGLHHCVVDLPKTLHNIASILKDGGRLYMLEPNRTFFLQKIRDYWYTKDKYFDEVTEAALDHNAILNLADGAFSCERVTYMGGPAYFVILNSLLFRLPVGCKKFLKLPFFILERLYNALPGQALFPAFAACWIKNKR